MSKILKIRLTPMIITGLLSMMILGSCSKEEERAVDQQQIVDQVQSGTWQISYFMDSGDDETHHFTGFLFTFERDGVLTASLGGTVYKGDWSITGNQGSDDDPESPYFLIFFNLTNDFEDLNEDWTLLSGTTAEIRLVHVSGGNGGTDYLTFSRIN